MGPNNSTQSPQSRILQLRSNPAIVPRIPRRGCASRWSDGAKQLVLLVVTRANPCWGGIWRRYKRYLLARCICTPHLHRPAALLQIQVASLTRQRFHSKSKQFYFEENKIITGKSDPSLKVEVMNNWIKIASYIECLCAGAFSKSFSRFMVQNWIVQYWQFSRIAIFIFLRLYRVSNFHLQSRDMLSLFRVNGSTVHWQHLTFAPISFRRPKRTPRMFLPIPLLISIWNDHQNLAWKSGFMRRDPIFKVDIITTWPLPEECIHVWSQKILIYTEKFKHFLSRLISLKLS